MPKGSSNRGGWITCFNFSTQGAEFQRISPPLKEVILIYNYIGMRPHSPMVKTPQLHCGIIGSIPVGVKFRNLFFIFSSGFTQGISQRKLKRRKVEKYLNLPGAPCASGEGFRYEYGQYRYSLGQCRDYI